MGRLSLSRSRGPRLRIRARSGECRVSFGRNCLDRNSAKTHAQMNARGRLPACGRIALTKTISLDLSRPLEIRDDDAELDGCVDASPSLSISWMSPRLHSTSMSDRIQGARHGYRNFYDRNSGAHNCLGREQGLLGAIQAHRRNVTDLRILALTSVLVTAGSSSQPLREAARVPSDKRQALDGRPVEWRDSCAPRPGSRAAEWRRAGRRTH